MQAPGHRLLQRLLGRVLGQPGAVLPVRRGAVQRDPGAYIDLEKDLFGDRATTPDELFALLEEAAENGFQLKPRYAAMRESMYKYLDHNNSQRTCQEIMKRNW